MSQNIRATGASVLHGMIWNVEGSGTATMSDSWIRLNPSIEEPSKPMPSANAPSSSCDVIVNDFRKPEDVGEPQAHEPDAALLDGAQHVLGLVRTGPCDPG